MTRAQIEAMMPYISDPVLRTISGIPDEVMRAAMVGELEPLRNYGVRLTIKDHYGLDMTPEGLLAEVRRQFTSGRGMAPAS